MIPIDSLQIPKEHLPFNIELADLYFYRPRKIGVIGSRADSLQDALEISTQTVSIMDQASMESRKWTPNNDELRQLWKREGLENQPQDNPISRSVNSTKILGMLWNTVEDHLTVGMQSLVDGLSNNENTKRHLLHTIVKDF
ncbi:hypothetical protein AVEN_162725-1 [Araneus ventricosus]|uniref:Uncharacterized protein n=1 Tax=Araneus ventricosus TaxID=182803 RepID=A0A4Y2WFP7_ARAVE|nr:hypothetical protein AVEN_162725-1 [Araneus ventricosus]